MKQILTYDDVNGIYSNHVGFVIRREEGETPNKNQLNNQWVLRDKDGTFIDFDRFREDLAERNNMTLSHIRT